MVSFSLSGLLFFAVLLYLVFKAVRRRKGDGKPPRIRTELDRWLDDTLAQELSRKLGLDRALLLRTLAGAPEPEAVGAMEEAVRTMQAKYARTPDGGLDVRLDVAFEDGTAASASRMFSMEHAPEDVKAEFARTGGAFVFRAVYFPWSSPG